MKISRILLLFILCFLNEGAVAQAPCGNTLDELTGEIESVGRPDVYPNNANCEWLIPVTDADRVRVTLTMVDVEPHPQCIFDRLEVRMEGTNTSQLMCGNDLSRYNPVTGRGRTTLTFTSDDSVTGEGWAAQYEVFLANPPCNSNPCQFGGQCSNRIARYICTCVEGTQGLNCEINLDDCSSRPCQNGGTCEDGINTYDCVCVPGFIGTNCETDVDECASSPCRNGARCDNNVNAYACECLPGYAGTNCETDIDECASRPCQNGARCTDAVASYSCACLLGFSGVDCEIDIDECASSPCYNGGRCLNEANRWRCECLPGFLGDHCETDVDECASSPCRNGGRCVDSTNEYSCRCPAGYAGTNCEIEINECDSGPCWNGGTCIDQIGSYSCVCLEGYSGRACETNLNASGSVAPWVMGALLSGLAIMGLTFSLVKSGYLGARQWTMTKVHPIGNSTVATVRGTAGPSPAAAKNAARSKPRRFGGPRLPRFLRAKEASEQFESSVPRGDDPSPLRPPGIYQTLQREKAFIK
ncbi:fibropellin-3-like [Lethenteron reissneri]|uniref:fibropellin-3-like n=1 Tax=Lethenteron reissneri TaxID=7753 RepID=UPI002AB6D20D|nr:fibropellin-3-like [Lethenteron reissneri]